MQAVANSPIGRMEPIQSGVHAGTMAYVPMPLPKALPLSEEVIYVLGEADRAVGTLAGVGETLPNPQLLIAPFMRREAVLSSRIEGTMSSLSDLFTYEASNHPRGDVVEVHNYLAALEEGLRLMRERNLPISMRMMNALHEVLMSHGVRGHNFKPGEFRDEQVWIGQEGTSIRQARFVPPPHHLLRDLIYDWELFANNTELRIPPLIQCAMLHYQFETIHPYHDGNGRIGRLLIILYLCARGGDADSAALYERLLRAGPGAVLRRVALAHGNGRLGAVAVVLPGRGGEPGQGYAGTRTPYPEDA